MSHATDSLPSAADFALPLDAARARARRLRDEAIRDFTASLAAAVVAAARRLARSPGPADAARPPVRPATHPAR